MESGKVEVGYVYEEVVDYESARVEYEVGAGSS